MSANRPVKPAPQPVQSYEQAVAELDALVQKMESGQLGLDDTLEAYKRGNELLKYCRSRLAAVEQQVQMLDADALKPLPADDDWDFDRG